MKKNQFINAAPAFFALAPSVFASDKNDRVHVSVDALIQEIPASIKFRPDVGNVSAATAVKISVGSDEWSDAMSSRFEELAIKHALDEASLKEEAELKILSVYRQQALAPRSFEEVKREFEIEEATNNAIEAIDILIRSLTRSWPS